MRRRTLDEGGAPRTWWDRPDEPPRALTDALRKMVRQSRRLVPPRGAESERAATIRLVVLGVILVVLIWLVIANVIAQS